MPSTGPRWTADRQAGPVEAAALGTPAAHRDEARTGQQPTGEGQERDCPRRRQSPRLIAERRRRGRATRLRPAACSRSSGRWRTPGGDHCRLTASGLMVISVAGRLRRWESVYVAVLEVRLLGPIEMVVDGRAIPLTAAKVRALLALLSLEAGTSVDADVLADRLWHGNPRPRPVQC